MLKFLILIAKRFTKSKALKKTTEIQTEIAQRQLLAFRSEWLIVENKVEKTDKGRTPRT
jgi:hypothetical protein